MTDRLELLDLVMTIREAAEKRYYSERTIRRWVEEGKVHARQSGGVWLIDVVSLLKYLAERESAPGLAELCQASAPEKN